MGVSKSAYFEDRQNELANLFKALGHPARIAIVQFLLEKKSCYCGDIVDELPLAQPTISQHLKELKTAGIIQGSIEGKSICYCLNPDIFEKIHQTCADFLTQIQNQNLPCC